MGSKSTWTYEQNKRFEDALAVVVEKKDVPTTTRERWEKIARAVGEGKTVEDVRRHYKALEQDIMLIESGAFPLPNYNKGNVSTMREEERMSQQRLR